MKVIVYFLLSSLILAPTATSGELTVYSSRNKSYLEPLFDDYSRDAGVAVSYVIGSPRALIERMRVEGSKGKADVLMVSGVGDLVAAEAKGVLASVDSNELVENIPAHLRSPDNRWFALSKRARAIVYNSEKVSTEELSSYKSLADAKWKGRLCLLRSNSEYTRSLVALLLHRYGEQDTLTMLQGWVRNLAAKPTDDDNLVIAGIQQGVCDVGVVNSYYFARLQHDDSDTPLKLFWPDQEGSGVSINITGAGVAANAPNREQAIDLLNWLIRKRQQAQYSKMSLEYPVNPAVYPPRQIGKWGKFAEDQQSVANAGILRKQAMELMRIAEYQ